MVAQNMQARSFSLSLCQTQSMKLISCSEHGVLSEISNRPYFQVVGLFGEQIVLRGPDHDECVFFFNVL
jgi:hypothetical protein